MNNINMVFGAPGCGKTTYLMTLLDKLLKEHDPDKIAFVSFTKKGSYEGRDRAMKQFNYKEKDFPYFRTIHSMAFRQIGASRYDMIDKKHYKQFSKATGMNFLGFYTEDLVNNDDKYLSHVSLKKNNPEAAKSQAIDMDPRKIAYVERSYNRFKEVVGIIDFDDLILDFIKRDQPIDVEVAIIDEAQDLTTLQWEFCKLAFRNCKSIFIAGDDDQAIYEWSGADVGMFLKMAKDNPIKVLDRSYRLKRTILNFSKSISSKITSRVEKEFEPNTEQGSIFFYNNLENVPINSEESYYFLSRNNYFLRQHRSYLRKRGVAFDYKGKPEIDKGLISAIRKYENFRQNNPNAVRQDPTILPLLKKSMTTLLPWYEAFEMTLDDCSYYRDIFKNKADLDNDKLHVNTIHGVKGGEADNVVVLMDLTSSVFNALNNPNGHDAELRCLYVGVTRAKKNLHLVYSSSKKGYDNLISNLSKEAV